MLTFQRITSVNNPIFQNLYNLYILAFPTAERRTWAGMEYEMTYEKRFFVNALMRDDKFVGLFNYWEFDRFYYVEHIAVSPALCSQHIGSEAMELFQSQVKLPIVLEVELPENSTAIRRIRFYEKLGFSVLSYKYAQPPYEGDGFMLPMQLMSNDHHFADSHYELIKETLYDKVYHFREDSMVAKQDLN